MAAPTSALDFLVRCPQDARPLHVHRAWLMADMPRTTDAAASALPARTHSDEAESRSRSRGPLYRVLWNEPWWLRGVTWPLVGIIVALAVMENLPQMLRAVVP